MAPSGKGGEAAPASADAGAPGGDPAAPDPSRAWLAPSPGADDRERPGAADRERPGADDPPGPDAGPRRASVPPSASGPEEEGNPFSRPPVWPFFLLGLATLGVILRETRAFTIPFAVAALFAVLLTPVMDWLERKRVPTALSLVLLLLGLFGFFAGLGALLYEGVRSVTDALPRYSDRAEAAARWLLDRLDQVFDVDRMGAARVDLRERLSEALSSELFLSYVNEGIGNFLSFMSSLLIMLLFLMFMLTGRRMFGIKLYRLIRASGRDDSATRAIVRSVSDRVQGYLVMKTAVSAGTGVLFGLVALAFGLDFPLVWGFLAFVFNYVPSIGPLIAVVPPILLAFFQFDQPAFALLTGGTLLGVNFLSGNVVEPNLMGNRLDLNVVVVLLSLFLWGHIWGFAGMLLAVPLTAVLNITMSHSPRYRSLSNLLSK